MSTAPLDEASALRPYCWEFHEGVGSSPASTGAADCDRCLVRRAGTLNCWELHGLLPLTSRRVAQCDRCDYYARYHVAAPDGADTPQAAEAVGTAGRTDGGEG